MFEIQGTGLTSVTRRPLQKLAGFFQRQNGILERRWVPIVGDGVDLADVLVQGVFDRILVVVNINF